MITTELLLKLGFKQKTWPKQFPSWYTIFNIVDDTPCSEFYTYTVWQSDGTEAPYCFIVFLSPRGPFGMFEFYDAYGAQARYVRITCESDIVQCVEAVAKFAKEHESMLTCRRDGNETTL